MADFDYVALAKNLLAELFAAAKGENSGPAKPPVESTSGPVGTKINDLINEFGRVAGAAGGAVIGLNSVKDAANSWTKTVEYLATQADKVGKSFGDAIRYFDYNRQLSVDAQKVGIGQGQGVRLEGNAQAAGYRNAKDEIDAIGKAGNSMRSFGTSAEDANNKFVDFGKKLQDSELAGKLKSLGLVTAREIANVAMIAAGGKQDMLNSAEGQKKLAEQTVQLATEIERTKNSTGKNRDEIISEMMERKASARSILEDRLYRSDAERQTADSLRTATAGMGKTMQDITSTIAAGGYLNKQQRTELQVATGGRAGQYMAAVRDNRRTAGLADNDPQKIAAQKRLDDEIARANAYQTSRQFAQRALTTQNPEQRAAAEKFAVENTEAGRQRAVMKETGMTATKAREELRNRGDVMLENRTAEGFKRPLGAPGTLNEGARPAQIMQDAVESFRKNAAAMTKSLADMNEELGRSPGLLKGLTTTTTVGGAVPGGMTQDQADANAKKNIETLKDTVGMGKAKEGEEAGGTGEGLKNLRNKTKDKREHGTLGELGVPTEPKDVVAKLHKGETVATPEQLRNLMSGSANNAISELMKSATVKTSSASPANNAISELMKSANVKTSTASKSNNDGIDISKITSGLKEITTTISSVSGGGSTTRSTVENDDAKAAKKELEAIKAQFQTEKNDIRSQVKSNLGPDAKGMDVVRAMRDNPQAKALEARMQEATSKLSERISAGTTTKTVTEPSINKTSITDRMSENYSDNISKKLASIKDKSEIEEPLSEKLSSIKDNVEIAEPVEPEQPKEETTFEEQSDKISLKDLNEQLIQLNTSIRQLIQHSAESVETASKQVKVTKSLSGNRFA